ncbi:DUF924 family protein [Sphingomonas turrisvirgatae]|uniref:DUF924 domain-containing protein n=1 Tax=Sphingomonas turrisvirgatae TaxID=1888892 RepID=A0A1E3LSW1_9SPHN|nr:DUF924 family protein [Sphingomonas turrisvirgatae]ODP36265.1 hypothetical protein BFL28_06050 [Sphingomonas turrisvirgatae]
MTGDLVAGTREVHDEARDVLRFWFEELKPEQQFAKDEVVDREIAERFGKCRDFLLATGAAGWREPCDNLLAAVIVLDQFSRNIHRGSAQAFAADDLALSLTLEAIGKGWDTQLAPERAAFLYMPLMHAENVEAQRLSLQKFTALGRAENLRFAMEHAVVIEQFGRFPSRNAALGRASTAEEAEYLKRPDAGW